MPIPTDEPKARSHIKTTHDWRDMKTHGTVSSIAPLPSRILARTRPIGRNHWSTTQKMSIIMGIPMILEMFNSHG